MYSNFQFIWCPWFMYVKKERKNDAVSILNEMNKMMN